MEILQKMLFPGLQKIDIRGVTGYRLLSIRDLKHKGTVGTISELATPGEC
jgi:hypothetical protein